MDVDELIQRTKDRKWSVRYPAIEDLGSHHCQKAEDALISIIINPIDDYDLIYANSSLSKIGTARAVPSLLKNLNHKKMDVVASALWALNEVGDSTLTPVFIEHLKNGKDKCGAMMAIERHVKDCSAVDPVIRRIKRILSRKRGRKPGNIESSELIWGLRYLMRVKKSDKDIQNLFKWVIDNKMNFLFDNERRWAKENLD